MVKKKENEWLDEYEDILAFRRMRERGYNLINDFAAIFIIVIVGGMGIGFRLDVVPLAVILLAAFVYDGIRVLNNSLWRRNMIELCKAGLTFERYQSELIKK